MQDLDLLFQLAHFGFSGAQVFLDACAFFLKLAQDLLQLRHILTRSIYLFLGLHTLVFGKRRIEQADQSKGDQGAKHVGGRYRAIVRKNVRPSMPAMRCKKNAPQPLL
ncbi:hypothetical protein ALP29_201512 [Pseudomonas syringae pv. avii]|uniref:Uncharacterized protein n=1 Tax=Pseudomonas syringae pv. avii TaxID=663959 RepID=A0A3M5UNB5_PSESX|nr:hypothetical protein ALP29_201512 [Pseudomonas syringae pv. avii]